VKKLGNRIAMMLGAAVLVLGIGAGSASANPDGDYSEQAGQLGLTATEAASLQSRVDEYLAKTGGTQVGINEIKLDGAVLLVPLPGERKARDLDDPSINSHECPYQHFCAYELDYYSGVKIRMFTCSDYSMPFAGIGSYINNQTPHTVATFKDANRVIIDRSGPATWAEPYYDWGPVYFVDPC
jgi:hypothetical protein